MAYRAPATLPDSPGWSVRVVPNLYPAFGPEHGDLVPRAEGLYSALPALGAHEVIVNCPEHLESPVDLPTSQLALVVRACAERSRFHADNPLVQYVHVIMNYGREAGASREHSHSQLFAVPVVPGLVEAELAGAEAYYAKHRRCLICDIVRQEETGGERVVWANDDFVLFAPFASRVPFELWLVPRAHRPSFSALDGDAEHAFARVLKETLVRLSSALGDPPFNYWIHTAPTRRDVSAFYHWHLELLPKLSTAAGFELGTDIMIDTVLPEAAAAFLRDVKRPGG